MRKLFSMTYVWCARLFVLSGKSAQSIYEILKSIHVHVQCFPYFKHPALVSTYFCPSHTTETTNAIDYQGRTYGSTCRVYRHVTYRMTTYICSTYLKESLVFESSVNQIYTIDFIYQFVSFVSKDAHQNILFHPPDGFSSWRTLHIYSSHTGTHIDSFSSLLDA